MRTRVATPPAGSLIQVRAKSVEALRTAAEKQVEAIKIDHHPNEPVLVVYDAENRASVFCEQAAIPPPPPSKGVRS